MCHRVLLCWSPTVCQPAGWLTWQGVTIPLHSNLPHPATHAEPCPVWASKMHLAVHEVVKDCKETGSEGSIATTSLLPQTKLRHCKNCSHRQEIVRRASAMADGELLATVQLPQPAARRGSTNNNTHNVALCVSHAPAWKHQSGPRFHRNAMTFPVIPTTVTSQSHCPLQ
jgi:hypothetical protein